MEIYTLKKNPDVSLHYQPGSYGWFGRRRQLTRSTSPEPRHTFPHYRKVCCIYARPSTRAFWQLHLCPKKKENFWSLSAGRRGGVEPPAPGSARSLQDPVAAAALGSRSEWKVAVGTLARVKHCAAQSIVPTGKDRCGYFLTSEEGAEPRSVDPNLIQMSRTSVGSSFPVDNIDF